MASRGQSPQGRILAHNRAARVFLYLAVGAGFLAAVCVAAQGYVLSSVVDRVFLKRQVINDVVVLLAMLLALALTRAALVLCSDVLAQRSAGRLKESLRADLTQHILDLGPAYTRRQSSGELVHTAVEGVEVLDEYVTVYQPVRLLARLVPVFVFLVILALDPPTTLILLFTGPMLLVILALIGSRTRDIAERRFRELSWMSAFFLDMLQGLETLKLFGRSREQIENIRRISRTYGNTTMEVLQTAFQSALVLEFGGTVATALVAVEISLRLMAGHLPFANALAVLVITPEFFLPLRQYALRYHAGAAGKAAAERIFAILDAATPAAPSPSKGEGWDEGEIGMDSPLTLPSPRRGEGAGSAPVRFDIRLNDVSVAYEEGGRPALQGFSLAIPERKTTALVGATGAGKTTVANLLLRFVEPDAGTIAVGGVELSAISVPVWRARLAWVPQLPHLFHGTVADNLRLARPQATMAEVIAAAEAAQADQFIRLLPQGYDTPLGEGGARLSGGQQQRLAIARAFLKDAPLLILDEATSHLDAESEAAIREALARLMRGRTVLIIAHRLTFVYAADQVALLDQGRVAATGDHRSLLSASAPYAQLAATYEGGAG